MDIKRIKHKVDDSRWRITPYRNGNSPRYTFDEIVADSFDSVKKLGINAKHCQLYEMYNPNLGRLRRSETYSALAPTNGMKFFDRFVPPDMRPYNPYKPKGSEWKLASERQGKTIHTPANITTDSPQLPLPLTIRRQYPVPADPTRYENFATYWGGRARGLEYTQHSLHDPDYDTYGITEDRRYQRLYWAPQVIEKQPTARHARQVIMIPYY
ncbi:unnamed protein product [Bursaphelenchus okinawaensis]|uniref:Uncharacterized protein n=1 Tax=Bursaphelenchus okinawaensis TaxID=465554 RepID=A0A811K739_9BILA|nr:unnamed protein product [Bursaphelenchus okinawaensis]CAG9092810.1 unnamed protein product [Bursaphelenchus okinawaensis]